MLTHIHVWNFAIVEQLDLAFEGGLTVLTGETGAGKSILLNALGLALGDRADSDVVRHGSDKAEVSVTFYVGDHPAAEDWLRRHELDSSDECIIRRTISSQGPSRAFINGKPSPVAMLRELGELLVDLHGQHEHQSLLKREAQGQLVDAFAADPTPLREVHQAYGQWKTLQQDYERLSKAKSEREHRLELLRYQVDELQALNPQANEHEELEQEFRRLANGKQLLASAERVLLRLQEDDELAVTSLLGQCQTELQELQGLDPALGNIAEIVDSATIQLNEAATDLRHYINDLELDPEQLEIVEQRLNTMHALARKHQVNLDGLFELLPSLQKELSELEQADIRLERLQSEIEQAQRRYHDWAAKLSQGRQQAAQQLSSEVTAAMQELGMGGGRFQVQLELIGDGSPLANGLERAEFLVSANPGQPLKPLNKVASGGEISRISLAIQVSAAQSALIPTLVFDEVDVGIGGRVAEIVGQKLRTLAQHRQVLCVTHLPQVAALGHHHMQVSKHTADNITITRIQHLQSEQRVDELARMLGGVEITEQTLSHAREMMDRAQV